MTKIEEVARACFASAMRDVCQAHTVSWDAIPEKLKDNHRHIARAAILAMREPTEAMLAAAREDDSLSLSSEPCEGCDWDPSEGSMWQAMIDAALKEGK